MYARAQAARADRDGVSLAGGQPGAQYQAQNQGSNGRVDFVVAPNGTTFPVPSGATGPTPNLNPAGN